jgi:hypothetical protein
MASRLAEMSSLERKAAEQWRAFATHVKFGRCETCGHVPVLVARQPRSRRFECLPCWDGTGETA